MSNSDGRADALAAAVSVFAASGATHVIHCGDVGGRHVLDAMSPLSGAFVWGDRDRDRMGLLRYGQSVGIDCFGLMGEMELDGAKIVVIHGDDKKLIRRVIDEQQYDILFCGHDLAPEDRTVGRTRILNPGPLHGGAASSALLINPATGEMRLLAL